MKLTVKTLKGSHFDIRVQPSDTIMAVKKNIEEVQGKDNYPWGQQLLIHNGKVLKDESTLEENKVSEDGFLVVMLSKSKTSGSTGASSTAQPSATAPAPAPAPHPASSNPPAQAPASTNPATSTERATTESICFSTGQYGTVWDLNWPEHEFRTGFEPIQHGTDMEPVVQQLMDMGGGSWDKNTVLHALRAAYNNPERAVEYLYSGIPATAEVAVPVGNISSDQASGRGANTTETTTAQASPLSAIPNSAPLDMFPQGTPSVGAVAGDGSLDFLRHNRQFQALRAMVQANPQILQPMLQELSKQNPQLLRLIQEHHAEFLQLINEPVEDIEGDLFDQPEQEMPHTISVTPAEQEAIARIEAMGFDRARVIEAFLACDRNEELAVNYLLEHAGDEE